MLNPDTLLKPAYFYVVRTREGRQVDLGIVPLVSMRGLLERAHAVSCTIQFNPLNLIRH